MRIFSALVCLLFCFVAGVNSTYAQYGHSPFIETVVNQVTDSSLTLHVRQLSGDTSVAIGGVVQTIISRHSTQPGNHKAAQLILEKFQSFGLSAELQNYRPNGYNVVATKTGTAYPNEQYIICAHYDAMPTGTTAPGADDNASGVAAVLEAARVLNPHSFDYTLKFIAFDEEEQGLYGSWAYADTAFKYGTIIKGVINLDMIAWDGNGDYEISVSSNDFSMPLMASFTDILRLYEPSLSPHLIIATASDHYRFWQKGYQALLGIEEYPGDFNPRYHSVNDLFQYFNRPYFLTFARGAIAALATMARDYRINMSHVPLSSDRFTGDRNVNLILSGPQPIDINNFPPRLYYKIDDFEFNYITVNQIAGDTFKFVIPGQAPGSKISYYFAAQDEDGGFSVTLPESGQGVNPPGIIPPPLFYSYYILNDSTVNTCATGLPMTLTGNQTVYKSISVSQSGHLLDLNVNLSLNHTNVKDINLFLISPSGREVMLSTKNGTSLDHYTNAVFDDEASIYIYQSRPPYTGSFKPERPLALFDDTITNGTWQLKIINAAGTSGTLTAFCLNMTFAKDDYYVDASKPVSGNGRSWATAFRTISEAAQMEPGPGSLVMIKPGVYFEDVNITSNGQEVVSLKTGASVTELNKVRFPAGTNLSGIDLANHPGEYYSYVFRSRYFNNGCFQVKLVNDAEDYILVEDADFLDEFGVVGDSGSLSALVFRPVIYQKYSQNPVVERVVLDADSDPEIYTVLYIGDAIGDGSSDALPASYNIIDGIDLTGSAIGGGVHLQSSSFNAILNSRIYNLNGAGILVNGNADHPAFYNLISSNEIFNTPTEGIYIGAGDQPVYNNQTHFTHLSGNEIYTLGESPSAMIENAIDIKDYNIGTLVERNYIHDIDLISSGNGALDIREQADYTVLNGNTFENIGRSVSGILANIMVHQQIDGLEIYNNIIFNLINNDDDVFALRIDGTDHTGSFFAHNTVYNTGNGLLLEDYGTAPDFGVHNNVISVNADHFVNWGEEGRFQISHNFYNDDPTPESWMPYYSEPGRQVGFSPFNNPTNGEFSISVNDGLLIGNGAGIDSTLIVDKIRNFRDSQAPDIGAFELENKIIWTGLANHYWSTPGNWNILQLPDSQSNVVIPSTFNDPEIDINTIIRGLLVQPGVRLIVPSGILLQQSQ